MKRRICFVLAALLLALLLGGCQRLCRHAWLEATCEDPKICSRCALTEGEKLGHKWERVTCETPRTCSRCGETRGEARGHRWKDATCEAPQICAVCKKTRGEPAGHIWQAATCQNPKTCSECGATEGTPLEHIWQEATTEAPRTCTGCGMTTGFAIDADERFTTAETAALQGKWMTDFAVSGAMVGQPEFTGELKGRVYVTFGNAGTLSVRVETQNLTEFESALLGYIKQRIYAEFAAKGLGNTAADLAVQAAFGMTTGEYAAQLLREIDIAGTLEELTGERVYYAEGSTVYIAGDWNGEFMSSTYRFENEALIFDELYIEEGAPLRWTRIAE